MNEHRNPFRRPIAISDWLELGDRLTPDHRTQLLSVFEQEEARLGADRANLGRAERMMGEGKAILDKVRSLRERDGLAPRDRDRLDAVIHTIEETQRLIASHYARLAREWLRTAGPLDGPRASGADGDD